MSDAVKAKSHTKGAIVGAIVLGGVGIFLAQKFFGGETSYVVSLLGLGVGVVVGAVGGYFGSKATAG